MDRASRSKAAYSLVDMSELDPDIRKELVEDAAAGGGLYGLRVVEEIHNGPAIAPIYGFYHFEQEKWEAGKKELGIGGTEVDDSTVVPGTVEVTDPRQQAALRMAAQEAAQAQADAVNAMDEEEVRKIVDREGDTAAIPSNTAARQQPNVNIVDATLNVDKEANTSKNTNADRTPKRK